MHWLIFLGTFILITWQQAAPVSMKHYRWEQRILLYFPGKEKEWVPIDEATSKEIVDRKLRYWVNGSFTCSNATHPLLISELEQIKKQAGYKEGQSLWVLIGLDGGVKMVKHAPLNWEEVFKVIDGMPMRQTEIRKID